MVVWVLVEKGLTGTENQCLGVCEALGVVPIIKRISLRNPWKTLSPYLNIGIQHGYTGDQLQAPWPDVLIAGGRKAIGLALWVKKQNPKTFTVCLQDPRVHRDAFDLIAAPAHDPARGKNVLTTVAAPNRITQPRLDKGKEKWADAFAHLPSPRVAVLIGGNSKVHALDAIIASGLGEKLRHLAENGAGLMVTASRRTGAENLKILQSWLKDTGAYIWDGQGDNPYDGFLALADYIVVTEDSVSMMSEAASTGKPVYRIDLQGGSKRFDAFHQLLEDKKIVRSFEGRLETWSYEPLNDAANVAAAISART